MKGELAKHAAKRTTKTGKDGWRRMLHYTTAASEQHDTIELRIDMLTAADTIITTYSTLAKSWAMGKAVPLHEAQKNNLNATEWIAHIYIEGS